MTVYYVDDGGSSTAPYDTWAKAAADIRTLDSAIAFASGDVVIFGHDSIDSGTSSFTITGPTVGAPVIFVSATQGSVPPAYQEATATQIATITTSDLTFNGSFALIGIRLRTDVLSLDADGDEIFSSEDCTFILSSTGYLNTVSVRQIHNNLTFITENTSDAGVNFWNNGPRELLVDGLSFGSGCEYRTANIIYGPELGSARLIGCDLSGATQANLLSGGTMKNVIFENCKTNSTYSLFSTGTRTEYGDVTFRNVGPSEQQWALVHRNYYGDTVSSSSIYRTGGATVEAAQQNVAWLITTEAIASEHSPYKSPWIVGVLESTGSKTFTIHVTNDSADFYDNEVWLEVEVFETAGSAEGTITTNRRLTPLATAVVHTDDTGSTWNGTGPSFTYQQTLSVTATVGQAGQYRARVVVGKASIASSAYFYVDPLVTVS